VAVSSEHVHFAQTCAKRYPRNPYPVTDIHDVWEMDLADLRFLSKYDKYKYLLNGIDIFSLYACSMPLKDGTISQRNRAQFVSYNVSMYTVLRNQSDGGVVVPVSRASFRVQRCMAKSFRGLFHFLKQLLYSGAEALGKEALKRFQYNNRYS